MSREAVILVLPFLQQYHADYGDYWRVSPEALRRMFEANGLTLVYQSFNTHRRASVYTFSIAVRDPAAWQGRLPPWTFTSTDPGTRRAEPYIGCHALANWGYRFLRAPFTRAGSLKHLRKEFPFLAGKTVGNYTGKDNSVAREPRTVNPKIND